MSGSPSKAASQRQLRVGEELRHVLASVIGRAEFQDPRLRDAAITVTEVRVSPDLKNATAFVLPLGGTEAKSVVDALNHAAGYLRGLLGRQISLRYTPRLSFAADQSFDAASRIEALLNRPKVRQDLEQDAPGSEEKA